METTFRATKFSSFFVKIQNKSRRLHTSTHRRFSYASVSHAESSLITRCFRWITLICPSLAILSCGCSQWLIVDNPTIAW